MDWDDWLLGLLALLVMLIGSFVMAIWALVANRTLRRQVTDLTDKFRMVDHRVLRLGEAIAGGAVAPPPAAAEPTPLPAEPMAAEPPVTSTEIPAEIAAGLPPAPEPTEPVDAAPPPPPIPPAPRTPPRWEQKLAENWLVWLGGVTLAMGGAFLVKLSIDYGLLTPAVRLLLAGVLGIGLAVGADWLARRENLPGNSSYVAQALAAAGAAILFASIYAAYQLYGLLPAPLAFPLLAATAIAATAMSLRHGPFVAALGLVGAYVVPGLVVTDVSYALPLFAYLGFVTAAALALLRHRAWWWLAWLSLAFSIGWTLLWLGSEPGGTAVVAIYLLVLLGLFAAFRLGIARVGFLQGPAEAPQVLILTRVAFWLVAAAMIPLLHNDGFGMASLTAAFAAAIFILWFGWRDAALDDLISVAGVLLLGMLASWELPIFSTHPDMGLYGRPPAAVTNFLTAAIAAALLLGGGCYAMLGRVPRPGRWAALSAGATKLILIVCYWRLHRSVPDLGWSSIALVLAAFQLGGAASAMKRRDGNVEIEVAIASYAIGVLAGTILAATFALSTAVLSVALALHLPAMGWIDARVRAPVIRWLALAVAAGVLVRLLLNPYVLEYPLAATPIFNWLLYGYGVPALAFIVATRQFGSRADDLTTAVLEAGSIVFTTALLTLELRHLLYARIDAPFLSLGRDSSNSLLWLLLSGGLMWLGGRKARPVLSWGGAILFILATIQVVLWQMMIVNPLVTGHPVGRTMIFDALSVAYALPALIYAVIGYFRLGPDGPHQFSRILATALALLWLSLEIRHAFRGENLIWGECSEGEWYAYSAAWLAFAAIGLGAGLYRKNEWVRRAALAGIGVVAAKVFLSDMAELTGVLRALSFMGLGAVLIGIGYIYRRFQPLKEDASA